MSGKRKLYRILNFTLYGIALILPYFVLEMSFSVMRQNPVAFSKYAWIVFPYIWFSIQGTLITESHRASWIVFSILIIPLSLFGYRFVRISMPGLFMFAPAALLIGALILFRIFTRIFMIIFKTDQGTAARFDPE